jgi:hypothetical protein
MLPLRQRDIEWTLLSFLPTEALGTVVGVAIGLP